MGRDRTYFMVPVSETVSQLSLIQPRQTLQSPKVPITFCDFAPQPRSLVVRPIRECVASLRIWTVEATRGRGPERNADDGGGGDGCSSQVYCKLATYKLDRY